jgi:hypothetical protein
LVLGPFVQLNGVNSEFNYGIFLYQLVDEYVPLIVFSEYLGFVSDIYFDELNCLGNAYRQLETDQSDFSGRLIPDSSYAVLPDGVSIARIDFDAALVPGNVMQSRGEFTSTPAGGQSFSCNNQDSSTEVRPMPVIGTLPATTPPYSVTVN